ELRSKYVCHTEIMAESGKFVKYIIPIISPTESTSCGGGWRRQIARSQAVPLPSENNLSHPSHASHRPPLDVIPSTLCLSRFKERRVLSAREAWQDQYRTTTCITPGGRRSGTLKGTASLRIRPKDCLPLLDPHLLDGLSGRGEVCQAHFRVLAREDHSLRAGPERGFYRRFHVAGLRFLLASLCGNVDVNPRVDGDLTAHTGNGPRRLTRHVVLRKPRGRQLLDRGLPRIAQDSIMQFEDFTGRRVMKERALNVLHILCQARPATVVIHHHLEEVRSLTQFPIVLLGAIEGAEGIVVPDVPAHLEARVDGLDGAENLAIDLVLAVGPELFPGKNLRIIQQEAQE